MGRLGITSLQEPSSLIKSVAEGSETDKELLTGSRPWRLAMEWNTVDFLITYSDGSHHFSIQYEKYTR